MAPQHTAYVVLSPVTSFHCFDGCISSSIFLIQSIKICFHLFFNFFRIFCAQHQIRFLITCNSFQPALYMVTEILEIIYLLFLRTDVGIENQIKLAEMKRAGKLTKPDKSLLELFRICLLYTSPSPRDRQKSRMPSS